MPEFSEWMGALVDRLAQAVIEAVGWMLGALPGLARRAFRPKIKWPVAPDAA